MGELRFFIFTSMVRLEKRSVPLALYVVGLKHYPNGFDDLLNNEITSPELTIADNGRMLDITITNTASDARLDVYYSNSLGHHLPGRVFTSAIPASNEFEEVTEC